MQKLLSLLFASFLPSLAYAQAWVVVTPAIPTLDEWGMIGMVAAVSAAGAWLISRRKK